MELDSPSKNRFVKQLEEEDKEIDSKVSELTKWLYDDDYEKRKKAASLLSDIAKHYPESVVSACPKFRELLRTDREEVQIQSLVALIYIGQSEPEEIRTIVGTSISLLYHENAKVRELASYLLIIAIDYYEEKVRPAIPRLVEMLDDPNSLPQVAATRAVAKLARYYPHDIKSEEVISQLNLIENEDFREHQRGPDLSEERVKYAKQALDNIRQAAEKVDIQLPESLLDDELKLRVVEHFENEQYQSAVQQAFITLEERIRDKGGYSYNDHGTSLVTDAFHYEDGPLAFGQTESEKRGIMLLYQSAFQSFRNPSSHRFLDNMEAQHAHHIICFVNLLLVFLGPK